jgi:hypothetical protein
MNLGPNVQSQPARSLRGRAALGVQVFAGTLFLWFWLALIAAAN